MAAEPAKDAKKSKEPVPLNKSGTVLLDVDGKRLLLKTKVCLREGVLEMFCCLKQTKEHESILSIDSEAYVIHTGLLALGAKPGSPVKIQPEYAPPKGLGFASFANGPTRMASTIASRRKIGSAIPRSGTLSSCLTKSRSASN